jgi:hypothetical protein
MFPSRFLTDESAAVTVDWVVLSAAIVGLGIGSVAAVRTGIIELGSDVEQSLAGAAVASLGAGNPLLAGIGTEGCDWYCIYADYWLWNEGPFNAAEFGGTLETHADGRIAEFQSYSTEFLQATLTHDYGAITAGPPPANMHPSHHAMLVAEKQLIQNIIAARAG